MKLPEGIFDRPRQEKLIDKDRWAIVRIDAGSGRYPHNSAYKIRDRNFDDAIAPYLHGCWEEFDRYFRFSRNRVIQVEGQAKNVESIYSTAEHRGDPKLPNITVIPNLTTTEGRGLPKPLRVFGTNMGHYHPIEADRIQEVYEFQTYGAMMLDRELGEVELWVARDGDKVGVPTGCHMTLFNLGDMDFPLITLNFSNPDRNPSDKTLISRYGPFMLGYYDDFEVVLVIKRTYVNNPMNSAGVRLDWPLTEDWERKIRISRGARLDLGRLLYEQLTQNPDIIGKFARLGIQIRQATPEAVLEPLTSPPSGRLYFSLPLVTATSKGTDVYRYFLPEVEAAKPSPPPLPKLVTQTDRENTAAAVEDRFPALDRPLVVLLEGVGDWVEQTYRPLFERKVVEEKRGLSVFYADDTRWKERPSWAQERNSGLHRWEVYLDKADPEDFARYLKLRPDVVFVVTPDFTHSAIAKRWLGKVPLVFLEKPFDSQITNVEDLRRSLRQPNKTDILGLDHYQFYALPLDKLRPRILAHLGDAIAKVEFYLTESRPIELNREKALQYGLTLDLLPHLIALLTYFGDIGTIDQICILDAGQYYPLWARSRPEDGEKVEEKDLRGTFYTETYSRVRFTFLDNSGNGFHVPCLAVVGKGFARDVKYLEIEGINQNRIRVDLKDARPEEKGYPWNSVFFIQGPDESLFENTQTYSTADPYREGRTLNVLEDPQNPSRFRQGLQRKRYAELIDDLIDGTNKTIISTLSLAEGQDIVRALDRIWWGIQAARPHWTSFDLSHGNPFESITSGKGQTPITDHLRRPYAADKRGGNLISVERTGRTGPDQDAELQTHKASVSVKTRGPLHTPNGRPQAEDLQALVSTLRREVSNLPLSILINGWPSSPAIEFLQTLSLSLEPGDAVWLVTTHEPPAASAVLEEARSSTSVAIDGSVNLNLRRKVDRRIYYNLINDLVFFPAVGRSEEKRLSLLRDRSRAIAVDGRGPYSQKIIEVGGRPPGTQICEWNGEQTLAYWHAGPVPIHPRPALRDEVNLEEIGHILNGLIKHHANDYDRRLEFRASLLKIVDTYSGRPSWGADLIQIADENAWPRWAVECLPQLFVALDPEPDGRRRALVWHYIVDCIPNSYEYRVARELCSKHILEIVMTEAVNEFVQVCAGSFHENLALNPRPSERSLLLAVNKSMMDIEYWIDQHEPELAVEFDEKRRQFVEKMKGAPL